MSVKETPQERDRRLALERRVREVAALIEAQVPRTSGIGFALFFFTLGEGGYMAYTSNANRADMVKAVKEWLAREERRS